MGPHSLKFLIATICWLSVLLACSLLLAEENAESSEVEQEAAGVLGGEVDLDAFGPSVELSDAVGSIVSEILVVGLGRTNEAVVRRELIFKEGQMLGQKDFEASLQRVKNLPMFRKVQHRIIEGKGEGEVKVLLAPAEKWTTVPILKLGSGGGSTFFVLGAYDPNSFGEFIELGAQYINTNLTTHSGVAWFREPRFLGERLLLGTEVWYLNTIRTLYTPTAEVAGGWNHERLKVYSFMEYELTPVVKLGGGFEFDRDDFNNKNLSDEQLIANDAVERALPAEGRSVLGELRLILGRLDYEEFLLSGAELTTSYKRGTSLLGSELEMNLLTFQGLGYLRLPLRSNLGLRVTAGHTNTDAEQHQFYVGGLDYVRGFLDGQLRGSNYWQANLEYRIPSVDNSWVVLQHALFVDLGDVGGSFGDLLTMKRPPRTSVGGGVRLLSPRIYRMVIRLDYAAAFGESFSHGISASAAQFF